MSFEGQICPYRRECPKYRNSDCYKSERFWECENYDDFKLESSGMLDRKIEYILEKLSERAKVKKDCKEIHEKCPYQLCCYATVCVDEYLEELGCYDEAYYHESCDIRDYKNCEAFEFNRESEELFGILNGIKKKNGVMT